MSRTRRGERYTVAAIEESRLCPLDVTDALLSLIAAPSTREDVVLLYATVILYSRVARPGPMTARWPEVNHAIIARWSRSALKYITHQAWARAEQRAKELSSVPAGATPPAEGATASAPLRESSA